jgi:hypothetical protein
VQKLRVRVELVRLSVGWRVRSDAALTKNGAGACPAVKVGLVTEMTSLSRTSARARLPQMSQDLS